MSPAAIRINAYFAELPKEYQTRAWQRTVIPLPRIPLTRYTDGIRLSYHVSGAFRIVAGQETGTEGILFPTEICGVPTASGDVTVRLSAVDVDSGKEVDGIDPVDIHVHVTE